MPQNDGFAATIARTYHSHLVPLIFEEYARDLAGRARIPADGRVLETACGTGVLTTRLLGGLRGSARLVATDLNPGMLDVTRTRINGSRSVDCRIADGTALPFADASFDRLLCQFGVMFFPDRDRGFREAARVLRPGGRFVFNVWDSLERNPFARIVHETVTGMFPDDPPGFLTIPFGYHDVSGITSQLHEAGFDAVEVTVLPRVSRASSARDVATALVAGTPLAGQLAARGAGDAALREVEAALIERFGAGDVSAPMQSIAFVASKHG
jgi:ubiquinone/menaquinone biosynthesis C-methylase UbiE